MEQNQQNKSYLLPIVMMFALFFMIAFVTNLQSPMVVIVKSQFGASNFQAQLGTLANFIAYAFMGIPAGQMLQRIGYKKTALTAVTVVYHIPIGSNGEFCHISHRCLCGGLLYVYAQCSGQSYAQHLRWGGQAR